MDETFRQMTERHTKEFDESGLVHFAFGRDQFNDMIKKWNLDPDDPDDMAKISTIGAGGYLLKTDSEQLHELFNRHTREKEEAIAADPDGSQFIYTMFLATLIDHEYSYTRDLSETLDILGYTPADIEADARLKNGLIKAVDAITGEEPEL